MIFFLKKLFLLGSLTLLFGSVNGQINKSRIYKIEMADSLYHLKHYRQSSAIYFFCFKEDISKKTDSNLFNAAKACSKGHYPDSAYNFLFSIIKNRDNNFFDQIVYGPEFQKLHNQTRWLLLVSLIDKQEKTFNKTVGDEMVSLRKNRLLMDEGKLNIEKQYGTSSNKIEKFQDSISMMDSINCRKWRSIINTYGWLGYEAIGNDGVQSEIYLYQHANINFQKFFFPQVAEAFKTGNIDANNYAEIADKISIYDIGKQIYGTQVKLTEPGKFDLFPIENKDSVNIRRHLIGLTPIP